MLVEKVVEMKNCNLIHVQRRLLKEKAEFEEQGTVNLSEKSPFVEAIDAEIERVDKVRQARHNRELIRDGRGWRKAFRGGGKEGSL